MDMEWTRANNACSEVNEVSSRLRNSSQHLNITATPFFDRKCLSPSGNLYWASAPMLTLAHHNLLCQSFASEVGLQKATFSITPSHLDNLTYHAGTCALLCYLSYLKGKQSAW
jgi:hypothetical protein